MGTSRLIRCNYFATHPNCLSPTVYHCVASDLPYDAGMTRLPFKSLFCERFGCSATQYEERAFRKCLYLHARFLAPFIRTIIPNFFREDLKSPFIRTIIPNFFREDLKFIRYLGDSSGVREAKADLLEYNDLNRGQPRFLRTGLKVRVSGRKATRLVYQLFGTRVKKSGIIVPEVRRVFEAIEPGPWAGVPSHRRSVPTMASNQKSCKSSSKRAILTQRKADRCRRDGTGFNMLRQLGDGRS